MMLHFNVEGQNLTITKPGILVSGSYNYFEAEFTFSKEWNDCDLKKVLFKNGDKNYSATIHDDIIDTSDNVYLSSGEWLVTIIGYHTEEGALTKRITTDDSVLSVWSNFIENSDPFPDVSYSTSEQVLAQAAFAVKTANDVATKAAQGEFDGISILGVRTNDLGEFIVTFSDGHTELCGNDLYTTVFGLTEEAKAALDDAIAAKSAAEVAQAGSESARDTALTYRNEAEAQKNGASTFASQAQGFKNDAEIAKNSAQGFASNASASASTALSYRDGAMSARDSANGYSASAKQYRDEASTFATRANSSSTAASASAASASSSASDAQNYKNQASRILSDVQTAGTAGVQDINSAGASQVIAVNAAGDAQMAALWALDYANVNAKLDANTAKIDSVDDTVTEQSAVIAEQQKVNDRQNKQIDTLFKVLNNQELGFDTQTETAYTKDVASDMGEVMGACAFDMLGGMSQVIEGEIRTAQTSEIVSNYIGKPTEATTNGALFANGTKNTDSGWRITDYFRVLGGMKATVHVMDGNTPAICWYDRNLEYIGGQAYSNRKSFEIEFPTNAYYARMAVVNSSIASGGLEQHYVDFGIIDSTAIPQDCPVMHGINDSVYDYVDLEKRKYRNMKRVNAWELPWVYTGTAGLFNTPLNDMQKYLDYTEHIVSNEYGISDYTNRQNRTLSGYKDGGGSYPTQNWLYLTDTRFSSVDALKAYLEENNVTIHYEATEGGEDYEAVLLKQNVTEVSLDVDWSKDGDNRFFHRFQSGTFKAVNDWYEGDNLLCDSYQSVKYTKIANRTTDKAIATTISSSLPSLFVYDTSFNDVDEFRNHVKDMMVYVELDTPLVLDVTSIFANFDNLIEVENGGTLTFKNSAENESEGIHIPVPSTIILPVRLGA